MDTNSDTLKEAPKKQDSGFLQFLRGQQQKHVYMFLVALIALPVVTALVKTTAVRFSQAQSASVNIYIDPVQSSMPPAADYKLMLNAGSSTIGFVTTEVVFDPSKVQLTEDVTTTTSLGRVILRTDIVTANSTGRVLLILGLDPSQRNSPPSGTFEIANLALTPAIASSGNTTISIENTQVVDASENKITATVGNATITLNASSPTATPTLGPTATLTPTSIPTFTVTPTFTPTPFPTATFTPTTAFEPTATSTPTTQPIGQQIVLLATDDSWVEPRYPNTNYGKSFKLQIDLTPVRITYIKFNLSSLAGKNVTSAVARFRVYNESIDTHIIRSATGPWTESTITYNNRPVSGDQIGVITESLYLEWKEVDLTSFINANTGGEVTLEIEADGDDKLELFSRHMGNDAPKLVVYAQ